MEQKRPRGYPKLKDYKPTSFMLPTSHYDKAKAERAVLFIENLRHTKGKWAGKRFWLLPWQEQIIRDIFGIVDERGKRQFRTAFAEIGKKNGKSELAAAVALYLLYADGEPSAEVYGAAADRQQASIVFDVANQMVQMTHALMKRSKIMGATKRIVNHDNNGFYQVLSAEVTTKHGLNESLERWSWLRTRREIGVPVVFPSNTPDRISTVSDSVRLVVYLLCPGLRLSRYF